MIWVHIGIGAGFGIATVGAGVAAKDTDPVGLAVPAVKVGVTVAVKATCWLTDEVRDDDTTLVVVLSFATTCTRFPGVPAAKFLSLLL